MNNPYENIDNAFTPFLNDTVWIWGKRKSQTYSTSISCCQFEQTTVEPFADGVVDSDVMSIKLTFPQKNWKGTYQPKVGDCLSTELSTTYKIYSVRTNNGFIEIDGRTS